MSFRFNFESAKMCTDIVNNTNNSSGDEFESHSADCNIILIDEQKVKVKKDKFNCVKCRDFDVKYITQESVSENSDKVLLLNQLNSDLLPGQYEGGLKVWECSVDLMNFLAERNLIHSNDLVLELGCGVGLPGLLSYLSGAFVTFQDYNSEVLELITIPNVILNTINGDTDKASHYCQFVSGDWTKIQEKFYLNTEVKKLYDVILTSETIYNKSSQKNLLALMKSALKPNGVIYLASKVHYFGVGGGIADFEHLLKEDNSFMFTTVFKTCDGVERQILKLTFKDTYRRI